MNKAAVLLQLLRLPQIGPVGLRKLLAKLNHLGVSPEDIANLTDDQLQSELDLFPEQLQELRHPGSDAAEDLEHCAAMGIIPLLSEDIAYPQVLTEMLGRIAPPILFVRGNLDLLRKPALGISGSRHASEKGLELTAELCQRMGNLDWVIVSGGARGVDEIAHLAALRSGCGTILVMPTGVLKPNFRRELERYLEEGKILFVSEFPPEQGWTPGCAMQRNRTLVALSQAAILVEPGLKGGTGGTGKIAEKLSVPLFILMTTEIPSVAETTFLQNSALPLNLRDYHDDKLLDLLKTFSSIYRQRRKYWKPSPLFPDYESSGSLDGSQVE
ncbi:MAG: DNA-processing protein DprA [bacterium]